MYCSPEWIRLSSLSKRQFFFRQSQAIIREGDPVQGIYFIEKGKAKIFTTGLNEKRQIVRFASDGHILGHRGTEGEEYPISAVAMEDSQICFLDNDTLNQMFLANPKFTVGIMMYYSRELRKLEIRMKNIAQMNLREKVAEALLLVQENFGLTKDKELNVILTREDLADTAATNYQQVSRQLTEFENEGIIKKCSKKIALLKLDTLKKIVAKYYNQ